MKKFLTMLLALVMALSLVACGQTEQPDADKDAEGGSTDPFYIWTWNTDYQKILDEVLPKYLSEEQVSRIQIVNVGDSNIYQDKIDAILADPSNEQYPDIMLLEVGYVQKYVQSGQLMKAADLGITAEDMSNMYDYNLKLGSDANGDAYALFWQATPGCWQIRTDLAEKYMGTTDPAELQEKLSTWDKVIEVSKSVNEQSGGKVKLLSGADDLKYVFCNGARTSAWYDADDNIVIDDAVKTYFELSKKLDGLTFDTKMWSTDWAALKDGDGEETEACIAFTGCPWYTYWCLTDTWSDNSVLIQGPQAFYWGGTGLAATANCSDKELARQIIYYTTCNTESMVAINTANGDYVNNKAAIDYIKENGSGTTSTYKTAGGQDIIGFFADKCDGINVLAVGEDQFICEQLLPAAVDAYIANGELDAALTDFAASIHDKYSYLNVK